MTKRLIIFILMFCLILEMSLFSKNISALNLNSEEKIIYLTFDDGPSDPITNKVLDILKENDVKATFFLIGNQIKGLEDVVTRINNDGHSIGLHTYTHKFNKIYSNNANFIMEMKKCQNEIKKVTNTTPTILRFPGGSRKHLSSNLLQTLHDKNLKIYDWNMETLDGINPKLSPYKILKAATNNKENLSTVILLLHCDYMHKNTCVALPDIIKYYKDHGYVFKPITNDTPELYFPIKK